MNRIAIFRGSNVGAIPEYAAATERLDQACVRRGIGLVYGGSSVGLMRQLADAVSVEGER
jgi:predicted Rossmann-fold nucleotide-binding protein